jgi:calmodulin
MAEIDHEAELKVAFKKFDKNSNGLIDSAELKAVLLSLGQKLSDFEISEMIREADVDGDGNISFDEFAAMLRRV